MIFFLRTALLFLILLLSPVKANPVKLDYATVDLISEVNQIQPGKSFWLALRLTLKPQWHTYWINPGDSGRATTIEWILPPGFTASSLHWMAPQWLKNGKQVGFGYTNESFYLVEITPSKEISSQPQTLKAQASWLACGDACVPESTEINMTLPVGPIETVADYSSHQLLIHQLKEALPKQLPITGTFNIDGETIKFTVPWDEKNLQQIDSIVLFPLKNGLINYEIAPTFTLKDGLLIIVATKGKDLQTNNCQILLQLTEKKTHKIHNYQLSFTPKQMTLTNSHELESFPLLTILFFALLGGFILNAMPCVFPILSIKALTIAKKKKTEFNKIRIQGLMYTIGVVTSFLALAFLLIALKKGGHSIGWGFQMQSPYFVTFIIYLTFLIGLSLSGLFYLPIFFGNATATIEESRKRDSFLLGVLAVLVATPCTAPFMGVAIGYALTQSTLIIVIVFTMLAIGFAIPYFVLCLFPFLLKLLPKPGAWMETFKELLAFPMYATALWLLWVLVQQCGSRALITIGCGLVIMSFCLWLWQKLRLEKQITKVVAFICFVGSSLVPIAYLPPPNLALSIVSEPFSKALVEKYHREQIPFFVNVTASWCITCKYNELTLTGDVAKKLFKEKGIRYLEADWTSQNTEITDFLEDFGRNGVPLYIYYPPNKQAIILPQLLTNEILKKAIEAGDLLD